MRTRNLIAVDAHKASYTFAVFDNGILQTGPSRRPNNEKNVRQLVRQFPARTVVVEACGVHEWMCDAWLDEGVEVFVAKPFKTDKREKSDSRDTVRLGQRYLSGELKQVWHVPPQLRLLRSVTRERSFLVAQRTQTTNHIRHELNRWNASDLELDEDKIVPRFPHIASNLALLRTFDDQIKRFDKQIRDLAANIEVVQHLKSIPGFGDVVALAFYAEIGDISRFQTAESLVKYLGLDPVWRQSGDSLIDSHHISKAGNARLRSLLLQAAWVHTRDAPESPFTQKFNRLVNRKPRAVAIIAVERHLVEVAWRLWRDNRDFTIIRPATTVI